MSTQTTTTEAASGAEGELAARFEAKREECEAKAQKAFCKWDTRNGDKWLERSEAFAEARDMARAAAPVTGTEGEKAWLPMEDAPTGVPIIAKHKPNARMPLGWVATIKLGHRDDEEPGALDTILHYNGDDFYRGFHGCWDGWLPVGSAAPAPQPAGAERVRAVLAEWFSDAEGMCRAYEGDLPDKAEIYVVAAKRSRLYLGTYGELRRAALGSGEGTAGASSGPGSCPTGDAPDGSSSQATAIPSRGPAAYVIVDPEGVPYWPSVNVNSQDSWKRTFTPNDKIAILVHQQAGWRCLPIYIDAPAQGTEAEGRDRQGSVHEGPVSEADAPHPQSPSLSEVEEAKALLEGLPKWLGPQQWIEVCRKTGDHKQADRFEAALATVTASQEQDGEVRS